MRGLCEGSVGHDELNADSIDAAFAKSQEVAFQAVRKPVEGTILTVLRDSAAAAKHARKKKMGCDEALAYVVEEAYASVQRTPDLLPVLKENGVVDAGGFGLAIFFDAFVSALLGKEGPMVDELAFARGTAPKVEIEQINDWEGSAYRYCTEFLVHSDTVDVDAAKDFLPTMGDCDLMVGMHPNFKVHVHSNRPDQVLGWFLTHDAQISEVHIHNMQQQSAARTDALAAEQGEAPKPLGFVAVADLKANPKLRFNAVHLPQQKIPSRIHAEFASANRGTACVTINAGYWWAGNSLSLLVTGGTVKSIENQTVTRNNQTVYPVRSSFGQMASGGFETHWIYCVLDDGNKPYAFPSALDNDERTNTYMSAPPTSKTPGAVLWTPQEAVGGGPMLVKEGKNVAVENYWKEVFDGGGIAGTSRQPRTAVGATADGKLILLVCDGRNMRGSAGFTLAELADKLIELGAVDAVNLDGGGSSTMVGSDGKVLNRPSDTGSAEVIVERKISTAVVISEVN